MPRKRDDAGRIVGTDGPERVLTTMEPGKAYATSELAETVEADVTHRTVRNWLADLEQDGRIERRKVNDRLQLWTLPPEDD